MIPVIATKQGYYGNRMRHPGDMFSIKDMDAFSSYWMALRKGRGTQRKIRRAIANSPPLHGHE